MRTRGVPVPNFTDAAWHAKRSDAQMEASILDGKGTQMPAFRGSVTPSDAGELVALVRSLCPNRPAPRVTAPTEFENRFEQLEQELGKLQNEIKK